MIALFITLLIIAVAVWAINSLDVVPPPFKKIITIVGVLVALLVIARAFGVEPHDIALPHAR